MKTSKLTVHGLMHALGGPAKVARVCGVTISAVGCWQIREEIPARHWLTIWRLALAAGIDWCPPGADDITIVPRRVAIGSDLARTLMAEQCGSNTVSQALEPL